MQPTEHECLRSMCMYCFDLCFFFLLLTHMLPRRWQWQSNKRWVTAWESRLLLVLSFISSLPMISRVYCRSSFLHSVQYYSDVWKHVSRIITVPIARCSWCAMILLILVCLFPEYIFGDRQASILGISRAYLFAHFRCLLLSSKSFLFFWLSIKIILGGIRGLLSINWTCCKRIPSCFPRIIGV